MQSTSRDVEDVERAERARCEALVNDDFSTLKTLISPDITHTHARGNTDDFEGYFKHVMTRVRFLSCERGPLLIRIVGPTAIMTGTMHNIVRLRGEHDDIPVSAQVLQLWTKEGAQWVLRAFQATPLIKNS